MTDSKTGGNASLSNLNNRLEQAIALANANEAVDQRVFAMAFGNARELSGLSREQLANATGLSLAHLTRIELGDHAIAPQEVPLLAQALNLPEMLLQRLCPRPVPELTPLPLPTQRALLSA